MNNYRIKEGYKINAKPLHFNDVSYKDEFQDEVYKLAKKLVKNEKLITIVDIGCGSGYKLIKYFANYDTIGIETEPCLSYLQSQYPEKTWIGSGENEKSFPNFKAECDLIICSDVIEHMIDPQSLLDYINTFEFQYLVISTPDRERLHNLDGAPINPNHVREWTYDEFEAYLNDNFNVIIGQHCEGQRECMVFICEKK